MKSALYHFIAIVMIGCALGVAVSFAYPTISIDAGWASLIALIAVLLEGLGVFVIGLIARDRERTKA
jgi:hypothetical protein